MHYHYPAIIVGGGQAGLSMSYCLKAQGIEHLVLEKNRVGHEWRSRRWDSFCLVTPNWQCQLPGYPYSGNDPYGFMAKDDIVAYLEGYAASFQPPIAEGVTVERISQLADGLFLVKTSIDIYTCDRIVIAVSGYRIFCSYILLATKILNPSPLVAFWWWAPASRAVKLPRICTLPVPKFIYAWVAHPDRPVAIEVKMRWNGWI
jgi:hypothetical protein